jgi:photosystem II stability/assembly factor-like uncharacterized protein
MKKIYKPRLCVLLFLTFVLLGKQGFSQMGQSGWTWVNPKPFSFSPIGASFIDDNTGLFAGTAGGIARTTNAGLDWQYMTYSWIVNKQISIPIFYDIQMVNANVAYACGSASALIKSMDGGLNWTKLQTPYDNTTGNPNSLTIRSLYFLNSNVGYIVGDTIPGNPGQPMFKTTDGGETWNRVPDLPRGPWFRTGFLNNASNPLRYDTTQSANIFEIQFLNENLGYAAGQRGLLWKYDGTSWKEYNLYNYRLDLDTTLSGYRPNQGPQVQNWSALNIIEDSVVVTASFNNNIIVRTNTSGAEPIHRMTVWASQSAIQFPSSISFTNPQHLLKTKGGALVMPAGSDNGSRFHISYDTGITWQTSLAYPDPPYAGPGVSGLAITPNDRLVFGGNAGLVADSVNGVWRRPYQNSLIGSTFSRVRFADNENGSAAGGNGSLAITKDNGVTWIDRSNLNDRAGFVSYLAMSYPTKDALYISTSNGILRASYDQGETFDQLFIDSFKTSTTSGNPPLRAMDWIDNNQGWVVSYRGHNAANRSLVIFKTKDGGMTWDSVKNAFPDGSLSTPIINDIAFVNDKVGYAVGNRATIWKTIDGGLTWERSYYGADSAVFSGTFNKVSVVGENIAWVGGNSGNLLRTVDGGNTWEQLMETLPFIANISAVKAFDANQVFINMGTTIVFTKNAGGSWQVNPQSVVGVANFLQDLTFTPIVPGCGEEVCNSLWAVGTSASILKFGSDKVLPVKFSTLTGSATSDGNQLFWTAFEQKDVTHFEVEGSNDGRKFSTLEKRIYGTGLASSSYTWLHKEIPAGLYYYRVKAVEKSGNMFFTNTIIVDNKSITGWRYQLMPNSLILNNVKVEPGNISVQVVNTSGQVVAAKNWKQSGGVFNDKLNLPYSAHGVYYIRVVNEGNFQTFKVFIP